NIDRFAFKSGSDHYPFHKKGIPVLDFYAGHYKRMNSAEDKLEHVRTALLMSTARLAYLSMVRLAIADLREDLFPSDNTSGDED
ncbi:MAG: M28 family peptidase, partial [Planctomycetota bacterium]|nr:M28 family peptidase [Planctomycetota bacterium]